MDSRDAEAEFGSSYDSFDESKMTLTYTLLDDDGEEYEAVFPAKYEVCGLCEGRGKHVNPSIDAHGISAEEFYDDPDFAESYMSGMYDVCCYRCGGKRVEPVIDNSILNAEQKKWLKDLEEKLKSDADYRREVEYERRMGY